MTDPVWICKVLAAVLVGLVVWVCTITFEDMRQITVEHTQCAQIEWHNQFGNNKPSCILKGKDGTTMLFYPSGRWIRIPRRSE